MTPDWQPEPITFHTGESGRVMVERWPRQAEIANGLIRMADPRHLHADEASVTLTVTNGSAVYRVVGEDRQRDCLLVVLESSRLSAP